MLASNQDAAEKKFHNTLKGTRNRQFKIASDDGFIKKLITGTTGYHYNEELAKDKIVIHSTAGYLKNDVVTLSKQNDKVSVAYVISRDGVVYEMFDPKKWAYHLGRGSIGGNKYSSSRSIAIELSNIGPLTLVDGKLETAYSRVKYKDSNGVTRTSKPDVYCDVSETEYYDECTYRGYDYYASFTDAQYKSLRELLLKLSADFDIPFEFLPEDTRYDVFSSKAESRAFNGICTHVNFRSTGKYDLGPFFDFDKVIYGMGEVSFDEDEIIIEPEEEKKEEAPKEEIIIPSTGASNNLVSNLIDIVMKILKRYL